MTEKEKPPSNYLISNFCTTLIQLRLSEYVNTQECVWFNYLFLKCLGSQ